MAGIAVSFIRSAMDLGPLWLLQESIILYLEDLLIKAGEVTLFYFLMVCWNKCKRSNPPKILKSLGLLSSPMVSGEHFTLPTKGHKNTSTEGTYESKGNSISPLMPNHSIQAIMITEVGIWLRNVLSCVSPPVFVYFHQKRHLCSTLSF